MKSSFLIIIVAFLVILPWLQGLNVGINNEVMVDGLTISARLVMIITIIFSLVSWFLFSWATKNISVRGMPLAVISGASIVIPFLHILGPMAAVIVGVVAGYVAFTLQKIMITMKNAHFVTPGIVLVSAYVVLTIIVATAHDPHIWDTGSGVGSWTGIAQGIEESGFDNIFGNNMKFEFLLAIIPSLIATGLVIRRK